MAKQITLKNLQDVAQRTKQYIDDKGGAMVYRMETTLYTNTTGQTGNITITLSQPFTNFDAIIVYAGTGTELKGRTTNVEISSADLLDGYNINFYPAYDAVAYATVNVGRYSTTDNMLWATIVKSNGWTSQNIAVGVSKVVGINYVPMENYSTTEQVVGTWIDGRPVYQKTVDMGDVSTITVGSANIRSVAHNIANFGTLVDMRGFMSHKTNPDWYCPLPRIAGGLCLEMACTTTTVDLQLDKVESSTTETSFSWAGNAYVTIKYTKASS